jgi:fimbrial chaperone protein
MHLDVTASSQCGRPAHRRRRRASSAITLLLALAAVRIAAQSPTSAPAGGNSRQAAENPVVVPPQFNITPTRLFIARNQTSTSLMLRNDGGETLRFQVSAFAWSNDRDGQMVLNATNDVVFFPMLFSVEPGQSRRVRVAVSERATERELSYRLFVEQLPSRAAVQPAGVQMLMRASIPVFVRPHAMVARAMLDEVDVIGGRLSFVLRNVGTVHVSTTQIAVRAPRPQGEGEKGEKDEKPFETSLPGWYLLAGESRVYHVTLPAAVCDEHPVLTIAVTFADNRQPLVLEHRVGQGDCAP